MQLIESLAGKLQLNDGSPHILQASEVGHKALETGLFVASEEIFLLKRLSLFDLAVVSVDIGFNAHFPAFLNLFFEEFVAVIPLPKLFGQKVRDDQVRANSKGTIQRHVGFLLLL